MFGLSDFASSHWVHSLCLGYFVCVRLFSCIISACMLCYHDMVRWAWLDWGLSEWLSTLLQCFDTVGRVIRPVKHRLRNNLNCVEWDVKPCSTVCVAVSWCCRWHLSLTAVVRETRRHLTLCWRHLSAGCCSSVTEMSASRWCRRARRVMKWSWLYYVFSVFSCHGHEDQPRPPLRWHSLASLCMHSVGKISWKCHMWEITRSW